MTEAPRDDTFANRLADQRRPAYERSLTAAQEETQADPGLPALESTQNISTQADPGLAALDRDARQFMDEMDYEPDLAVQSPERKPDSKPDEEFRQDLRFCEDNSSILDPNDFLAKGMTPA